MGSKSIFGAVCLVAALAAVACGTDDDGGPDGTAGSSGKGNAGSSGKANAGSGNKAGGSGKGGDDGNGGNAGVIDEGMGGEGGQAETCTHLSEFVHTVIKDDTNAKSSPRPVNGLTFCDDAPDPAAYSDLF